MPDAFESMTEELADGNDVLPLQLGFSVYCRINATRARRVEIECRTLLMRDV